MSKINKALDLNKLYQEQAQGKQLKKKLSFPILAQIKYDGNYVTVRVEGDSITFTTSGGLNYTHTDDAPKMFETVQDGVYIAERIWEEGKLGDRNKCNLRGPKSAQTSTGHAYVVHDYLTLEEYDKGKAKAKYFDRLQIVSEELKDSDYGYLLGEWIHNEDQLNDLLRAVTGDGYEGLMLKKPEWKWKHTTSRTMDVIKVKKRPTVDLECVDWKPGTGKYTNMLGSLKFRDSEGREVWVGSGLDDSDRAIDPMYFIGNVFEIEYEQIVDTYIQPTIVCMRSDKNLEDID